MSATHHIRDSRKTYRINLSWSNPYSAYSPMQKKQIFFKTKSSIWISARAWCIKQILFRYINIFLLYSASSIIRTSIIRTSIIWTPNLGHYFFPKQMFNQPQWVETRLHRVARMSCHLKQDNYKINIFVRTHLLAYLIIAQSIIYMIYPFSWWF